MMPEAPAPVAVGTVPRLSDEARALRRWCARPGCRHAPSRHGTACSCGCPGWVDRWPHWWRELTVDTWFHADQAWQLAREAVAIGYATEEREYAEQHPRPTFK